MESSIFFLKKYEKEDLAMEKRLNAEWITYMKAYRLYDPRHPQQTVAYEDSEEAAKEHAVANGYDGLVICDADTMHIETTEKEAICACKNCGRKVMSQEDWKFDEEERAPRCLGCGEFLNLSEGY